MCQGTFQKKITCLQGIKTHLLNDIILPCLSFLFLLARVSGIQVGDAAHRFIMLHLSWLFFWPPYIGLITRTSPSAWKGGVNYLFPLPPPSPVFAWSPESLVALLGRKGKGVIRAGYIFAWISFQAWAWIMQRGQNSGRGERTRCKGQSSLTCFGFVIGDRRFQ